MATAAHIAEDRESSLDLIGAAASVMCAVHCAAVALLLGIAPALQVVAEPWIDWLFLSASFVVGLLALVPGYRQHRNPVPLTLFTAGVALLVAARMTRMPPSKGELVLVLIAAAALIAAHWRNRGELRACRCGTAPRGVVPPAR